MEDDVVIAALDENNKITNVNAEKLQELLAITPQQLQERLMVAANTSASKQ